MARRLLLNNFNNKVPKSIDRSYITGAQATFIAIWVEKKRTPELFSDLIASETG